MISNLEVIYDLVICSVLGFFFFFFGESMGLLPL